MPDASAAELEKEANTAVDQAFKDFEAKKYREAAQGFLRAYDLTGAKFPKQLRNAGKAYTAGGLFEDAARVWERLANLARADDAMRKEAKEQLQTVRGQWAEQLKSQGDAVHKGKQSRAAADTYVRAWWASGRGRSDVLLLAAKDYETAKLLDDAHLAYMLVEKMPASDATQIKLASTGAKQLLDQAKGHPAANLGLELRAAGQFTEAANQLLMAFDAKRERLHLRLAAQCYESAEKFDDALATWSRYELHDPSSLLGTDQARARQTALRRHKLKNEAKAAAVAGRHQVAGQAWLAMYDVSQEHDVVALREAAQAFEQAGHGERAKVLWQRLADSPYASDAERSAAAERKVEVDKNVAKPVVVVTVDKPPPATDPVDSMEKTVLKIQPLAPQSIDSGCSACWALAGGGGAVVLGSATLVFLARGDQSKLLILVQEVDSAGRITGVYHQEAVARQDTNLALNSLGMAGLIGGAAAVAAGALIKWVQGPQQRADALPFLLWTTEGFTLGARF
ncbi:MAG: hypothetical protein EXR77_17285 [Myxococcales bacterium]|nr:hypothetical protein [Myxococcales bacterium]